MAICEQISEAVNKEFEDLVISMRFSALGYRDEGDSQRFLKCPFHRRPQPKTREEALAANKADATRVAAFVRVCLLLTWTRSLSHHHDALCPAQPVC